MNPSHQISGKAGQDRVNACNFGMDFNLFIFQSFMQNKGIGCVYLENISTWNY